MTVYEKVLRMMGAGGCMIGILFMVACDNGRSRPFNVESTVPIDNEELVPVDTYILHILAHSDHPFWF